MRCRLSDEDAEQDKGIDPRVLFKGVDQAEAKDGHHVGDDGDDDDDHGDAHGIAGHGAENLANHNIVDNGKATSHDDVEDTAQFGAPEAERISRYGDLSHAELSLVSNC